MGLNLKKYDQDKIKRSNLDKMEPFSWTQIAPKLIYNWTKVGQNWTKIDHIGPKVIPNQTKFIQNALK